MFTSVGGWFIWQQNKKKAKAEGKKCHAKTMWSQGRPQFLRDIRLFFILAGVWRERRDKVENQGRGFGAKDETRSRIWPPG